MKINYGKDTTLDPSYFADLELHVSQKQQQKIEVLEEELKNKSALLVNDAYGLSKGAILKAIAGEAIEIIEQEELEVEE